MTGGLPAIIEIGGDGYLASFPDLDGSAIHAELAAGGVPPYTELTDYPSGCFPKLVWASGMSHTTRDLEDQKDRAREQE